MRGNPSYEILGVGNPLLDYLLHVSEHYLESVPGAKYGMELVSYEEMIQIIERSGSLPKLVCGGSCANTIKGLASLGRTCALAGKIGIDCNGEKVIADLENLGIFPKLSLSSTPTAQALCMISPDGKRTCRTFLGAAAEISPQDLDPRHFERVQLVHIEGYSLLYPGVSKRAMELAKAKGALVSFDLGSFEIVAHYLPLIKDLIKKYVDITFANEQEIFALTGKDPENGCRELHSLTSVAVVMMGEKGCWTGSKEGVFPFPAYVVDPIDTTGAGDLFAAGFLHAFLSKKSMRICAQWGALTARAVVQVIGAEITETQWSDIKSEMKLNL